MAGRYRYGFGFGRTGLSGYGGASAPTPTPTVEPTFGRLTTAGTGAWKRPYTTSASATLTGTNADHFTMSTGGVLTPTAAFVASPQASYTLGATINGAATTLNITTEANAYTVATLDEANALDWANMTGKTVAFRGPLSGGPVNYQIVQPGQQNCSVNWWSSRSWVAAVTCKAADATDKPLFIVAAGGAGTRYSIHMTQVNNLIWDGIETYAPWYLADEGLNYGNSGGTSTAVGALKQPAIWLRNTVGNFEIKNGRMYANLTEFPMADGRFVWYGALGYTSGSTVVGHLNIHDNVIHGFRRLFTIPDGTPSGQITIKDNEGYDFGADCITLTKALNVEISWNYFHSAYTNPADVGHGDFVQSIYNGSDVLSNVNIFGNILTPYRYDNVVTKHAYQGLYFDDITAPGYYDGFRFYNNLIVTDMYHGVNFSIAKNCYTWRNTLAKDVDNYEVTESGTTGPWAKDSSGSDNNTFQQNFASSFSAGGTNRKDFNNIASNSAEAIYLTNFAGDGSTWRAATKAGLLAMYAPKIGGQVAGLKIGALGSYIDHAARTVDTADAPWNADTVADAFTLTPVANATPGSVYTQQVTVAGVSATIPTPVWAGLGQRVRNITTASAFANSTTALNGHVLEFEATALAGSGTVLSVNPSIGGTSTTWTVTNAVPDRVQFDGTNDYMLRTATAPALTGTADSKIVAGVYRSGFTGGDGVLAVMHEAIRGTSQVVRLSRTAANLIQLNIFNSAGVSIFNRTTTVTFTAADADKVITYSWNSATGEHHIRKDGVDMGGTPAVNTADAIIPWSLVTIFAVGASRTGTAKMNAILSYDWLSTSEFVDWSDSDMQTAALPDNIGATGQNITGTTPPVFIRGNAAAYNGGTANNGTGGAFTVTGAVTDA